MKRNETERRIRFMGIRYAVISGSVYAACFAALVLVIHLADVFLSFKPVIMLALYLSGFVLSVIFTKIILKRPFLKHVIYDTGI